MKKRLFALIIVAAAVLAYGPTAQAAEFSGFKAEYLNAENTNLYGFGIFTSNKRFDAEAEFFLASKAFTGSEGVANDYKFFFFSFAGYFHFIRTDSVSYYIGTGIFPFIPKVYIYHATFGMDFFWSENFRVFYNYRYLFNNADESRYPKGSTFAAGFKYTWDLF